MNLEKRYLKIMPLMLIATMLMAACSGAGFPAQLNDGQLTICHATGVEATPYEELTLEFDKLTDHTDHADDFIPAADEACPEAVEPNSNDGKVTICHAASSTSKQYIQITVDFNGLNGHSKHEGDIVPAPEEGCPSETQTNGVDGKITICHATNSAKNPYVLITISVNGLNGHGDHAKDIIPAPASGCPS